MAVNKQAFRDWLTLRDYSENTVAAYLWTLGNVDASFGVDEKLSELGTDGFLEWVEHESAGPFARYPANSRTVLRRYAEFSISDADLGRSGLTDSDEALPEALVFQLEREMQRAVRLALGKLETGLVEADDGAEWTVATGRIDIVARDAQGKLVVIELKAGLCSPSALEQVLGYADALEEETGEDVRAVLIAGEFTDRTRAAARRTKDLKLYTYEFSMQFNQETI